MTCEELDIKYKGKRVEIIGDHPFAGEQTEFVCMLPSMTPGGRPTMQVKNAKGNNFLLTNTQAKIL